MKELSIEEKAKRYDEAIEKAKDYHKQLLDEDNPEWASEIEKIFPELKESDDERIRKELISYLDNFTNSEDRELVDKFIAWLEKQVPACLSHDDEIMIRQLTEYFTTGKGLQNTNDTVVEWLEDVKRKLEKQGKQKSIDDLTQQEAMDIAVAKCFEQGEQKPTNNQFTPEQANVLDKHIDKLVEQKHDWSEEDESRINRLIAYFEDKESFTAEDDVVYANWLKSLKERVLPRQEWKQENTDDLTDFENAMMHIGGSFFGDNAGLDPNDTNVIKEQANLLLELVPNKEWGEEDEKNINFLCKLLTDLQVKSTENEIKHGTNSHSEYYYNIKKWLKDKVQSQPQIEWSEEDETMITNIIIMLKEGASLHFNKKDMLKGVNWLNSLRERYTWKPSEEQITWLYRAADDASENSRMKQILNELLSDLKKLREE